jgi:hypothetical protein
MSNGRNFVEAEILEQGVKRVLIKFPGGMRPPQQALVGPGSTTQDLLNHLGLSRDYALSAGTGDTTFGLSEIIYPLISDGDLLFATSRVDAGS